MRTFEFSDLRCGGCGASQRPPQKSCPACGGGSFVVEIERSASGLDVDSLLGPPGGGAVGMFAAEATGTDDGGSHLCFKTHSYLQCEAVSGDEIVSFMEAPVDERRRMYVAWKRREIEARLDPDQAICERCKVAFKKYDNEWNRAGFCSKTCHQSFLKSRGT